MNEKQAKRLRRMIREANPHAVEPALRKKYKAEKRILKNYGLVILLADITQRQGPLCLVNRNQLRNSRDYV